MTKTSRKQRSASRAGRTTYTYAVFVGERIRGEFPYDDGLKSLQAAKNRTEVLMGYGYTAVTIARRRLGQPGAYARVKTITR